MILGLIKLEYEISGNEFRYDIEFRTLSDKVEKWGCNQQWFPYLLKNFLHKTAKYQWSLLITSWTKNLVFILTYHYIYLQNKVTRSQNKIDPYNWRFSHSYDAFWHNSTSIKQTLVNDSLGKQEKKLKLPKCACTKSENPCISNMQSFKGKQQSLDLPEFFWKPNTWIFVAVSQEENRHHQNNSHKNFVKQVIDTL